MADLNTPSKIPVRISYTKPVEAWREFVKKRWNPETRYLNLDVSYYSYFFSLLSLAFAYTSYYSQ